MSTPNVIEPSEASPAQIRVNGILRSFPEVQAAMSKPHVDGTATDPRGLRNAMLRDLTEDLAELLYRIDAVWLRSTSREPFRNIAPAGQSLFRAKAEQIVALVDPWCLGRASSRAIEWAALSNNLDGGDWNEATQDLGRQMAHDAISVLLLELSRMYREDVGRS